MVLLLEGANCCGKSTIAASLASDLGLEIVKFSMAPKTQTFDYFWDGLVGARRKHEHLIVDRAHLSNAVYGDVQGSGLLNPNEWQFIDQWFVQQNAWMMLMTDDVFRVEARVRDRNREIDVALDRPTLATIQRSFEQFYNRSQITAKGQYSLTQFFHIGEDGWQCGSEKKADYEKLVARLRQEMG
jgi:hypothetical protein